MSLAKEAVVIGSLDDSRGVNLYVDGSNGHSEIRDDRQFCELAITNWFSQVANYNSLKEDYEIENDLRFYREYTQLAWQATSKTGCAYAQTLDRTVVVCTYDPKGNRPNEFRKQVITNSKERHLINGELDELCRIQDPVNGIIYERTQNRFEKIAIRSRIKRAREQCDQDYISQINRSKEDNELDDQSSSQTNAKPIYLNYLIAKIIKSNEESSSDDEDDDDMGGIGSKNISKTINKKIIYHFY